MNDQDEKNTLLPVASSHTLFCGKITGLLHAIFRDLSRAKDFFQTFQGLHENLIYLNI